MKLLDILTERKFSRPDIAYHATRAEYVPSIIKQGLIPNKKNNGYGSGEKSDAGYSLNALTGTYLTYSGSDANYIAKSIVKNSAILIVKTQSHTTELDEDRVSDILDEATIVRKIAKALRSTDDIKQIAHDMTLYVMENESLKSLDNRLLSNVEPLVYDYLFKLTIFINNEGAAGVDDHDLKIAKNKLTIALKNLVKKFDKSTSRDRFKINQPITFSGANKIVGIYIPLARIGWGDLEYFERDAYHKVDSPQKLTKYLDQ